MAWCVRGAATAHPCDAWASTARSGGEHRAHLRVGQRRRVAHPRAGADLRREDGT